MLFSAQGSEIDKCFHHPVTSSNTQPYLLIPPPPSSSSSSSSSSSVSSWTLTDLFRPRLIVSPKVFQIVFVHLVCSSALFLASCCCSYLLHVVASLICIFFGFPSAGSAFSSSKFPSFLYAQKSVPGYSYEKFHLECCQSFFF